jgi:hypothetical protein
MNTQRLTRILSAMPLGMGAGLFRARDLRTLAQTPPTRSDLDSLRGDWMKIGGDFRVAAQKLETSLASDA